QAEDGIRDRNVTGVQTCALPIYVLCSERISWKQYSVCDVAFFCIDVNTHFLFSFNFKNCSVLQPIPVILKGFVIYREWHACVGEIGRASCRERMWLEGG